ncbi:hypothetical protein [uncultured Thiodictyon sp.]|uniref:hypothetical protein n=1 Tax=uncultured Thiodictyon sp. TaxID=1846217 RepID=UPI0025D1DA0A|nr:hypothetical protein [uncultured Thiodictyon sp.]
MQYNTCRSDVSVGRVDEAQLVLLAGDPNRPDGNAILDELRLGSPTTSLIVTVRPTTAANALAGQSQRTKTIPEGSDKPGTPVFYDISNENVRTQLRSAVEDKVNQVIKQLASPELHVGQQFSYQLGFAADVTTCASASFLTLFAPSNDAYRTTIVGRGNDSRKNYDTTFGGTSAARRSAADADAILQNPLKAETSSFLTPTEVRYYWIRNGEKEIGKVLDADHPYAADTGEAQPEPVRLGEPLDTDAQTTLPSENTHPTISIGPSLNASAFFPIENKGTAIPR